MLEDPKKFSTSNFFNFLKNKHQNWDLASIKRNKVRNFGFDSPDLVAAADGFMVGGP